MRGRRRRAGVPARDAHAQDAVANAEAQRRVQQRRLAVDARRHRAVGVDLERRRRPLAPRPPRPLAAAVRRRAHAATPSTPSSMPRARARADRAPEAVAVVRDQDHGRGLLACRRGRSSAGRPRRRVRGRARRARCRAACAAWRRGSPRAGRPPRRRPSETLLTNTRPFTSARSTTRSPAVHERVERADDVVAVHAEVEREMVARSRRDAGVGQSVLGGDRRDDRLRAVAARHRERVGAALDGRAHERLEVAPGSQLDRLDAAGASLLGEVEALGLAAAGARVEEQHRAARAARRAAAGRGRRTRPWWRPVRSRTRATISEVVEDVALAQDARTAAASSSTAPPSPTARAAPRRSTPYQAATARAARSRARPGRRGVARSPPRSRKPPWPASRAAPRPRPGAVAS